MATKTSKPSTATARNLTIELTIALRDFAMERGMIWQIDDPNRPDGARNVPAPKVVAQFDQTNDQDKRTGLHLELATFNTEIATELLRLWRAYCLSPDHLTLPPRARLTITFEDYIS